MAYQHSRFYEYRLHPASPRAIPCCARAKTIAVESFVRPLKRISYRGDSTSVLSVLRRNYGAEKENTGSGIRAQFSAKKNKKRILYLTPG